MFTGLSFEGEQGRVARVIVERTRTNEGGNAVGTGEHYTVAAGLVVACIGYRSTPIVGVPYDAAHGRFANDAGRIAPGLYCVGWARRGPSGTIGTNRPDGYAVIDAVVADIGAGASKRGWAGIAPLLAARGVEVVDFNDWQRVDAAEVARARRDAPREKFTSVGAILEAARAR